MVPGNESPELAATDMLTFLDEADPAPDDAARTVPWRILIVDDEPDVHHATLMALRNVTILGRRLEFLHAYSAGEARRVLLQERGLAVVLLDVVMEANDAGLQLVRHIRQDRHDRLLRIILRTGQPGYAPEIDTIRSYDINDYQTKSELTRVRLFTSITVAIRSFYQLQQLEASRRGLEMIVSAGNELLRPRGLRRFAEGVVTQLCALLGVREEGLVCAARHADEPAYVAAAAGRYSPWIGRSLSSVPDPHVRGLLQQALSERRNVFDDATCLYIGIPDECTLAVFVDVDHVLSDVDRHLLGVFCSNMSVAFENTQLYQRISDLAYEDTLLKLPNRNRFLDLIEQRTRHDDTLALVDLDSFADINSILDQSFGDAVLTAVAQRLYETFSPEVVLSRVGSDLFGLLGGATHLNGERLAAVFATPFEVGEESLRLSATTGFVHLQGPTASAVELLKHAGVALKQAKSFNRGKYVYFEPTYAQQARERMHLLSRLRLAFSAERLFLAYQPFVNLASGRILGAEALLRWRTEDGNFIPPERFIPLAERSGLMVAIGDWVLREAFIFLRHINAIGHPDFRLSVNVSHVQFREPDFADRVLRAIADHGVNPANVEIELNESVAIGNIELIGKKLAAVRAAGATIAIDDFGTGYSSLNVLRQLHIDRLKIDRTFVSGTSGSGTDHGIADMMLQLAQQLGLSTTAEGIEHTAQRDRLAMLGCQEGQGYLYSEALDARRFEALLTEHRTLP